MRRLLAALALLLLPTGAFAAITADEMFEDPDKEQRARALFKELRCLVCQSEAIDESNAELARDLRFLVREQIEAGYTDDKIRDFLVARYGDYVLFRPRMSPETYLLWFGPALLLVIGSGAVVAYVRNRRGAGEAEVEPLSEEDRRRLEELLAEDDGREERSS